MICRYVKPSVNNMVHDFMKSFYIQVPNNLGYLYLDEQLKIDMTKGGCFMIYFPSQPQANLCMIDSYSYYKNTLFDRS